MTLTLGNLGAKDSVGKHSVTLTKQGGGTNGVVPLTGSVLCALYQEYVVRFVVGRNHAFVV